MPATRMLRQQRNAILAAAAKSLSRDTSSRYRADGAEDNSERLGRLFDALIASLEQGDGSSFTDYLGAAAEQRFREGFGLGDVLTACNAIELAIKACLVVDLRPDEFGRLSPLVHEVLQAGKRRVVACYLSLPARRTTDLRSPPG